MTDRKNSFFCFFFQNIKISVRIMITNTKHRKHVLCLSDEIFLKYDHIEILKYIIA